MGKSFERKATMSEQLEEIEDLKSVLRRCRTVLGNMAAESNPPPGWLSIRSRWAISDEPLRHDAKNLLPVIDDALST